MKSIPGGLQWENPRGLCITTRCTTVKELLTRFSTLSNGGTLFVPAGVSDVGVESACAVVLADKTPVLLGRSVVIEAWANGNNPFKRPGIRVRVLDLKPTRKVIDLGYAQPPRLLSSVPSAIAQFDPQYVQEPTENRRRVPTLQIPPLPAGAKTGGYPAATRCGTEGPAVESELAWDNWSELDQIDPDIMPVTPMVMLTPETRSPARNSTPSKRGATRLADGSGVVGRKDRCGGLRAIEPSTPPSHRARVTTSQPPISAQQPAARRTPGSSITLPANPFMDLTDASIQGFVDCTLFEETSNLTTDTTIPVELEASVPDAHQTGSWVAQPRCATQSFIMPSLAADADAVPVDCDAPLVGRMPVRLLLIIAVIAIVSGFTISFTAASFATGRTAVSHAK